jgi:adenylate kinase
MSDENENKRLARKARDKEKDRKLEHENRFVEKLGSHDDAAMTAALITTCII